MMLRQPGGVALSHQPELLHLPVPAAKSPALSDSKIPCGGSAAPSAGLEHLRWLQHLRWQSQHLLPPRPQRAGRICAHRSAVCFPARSQGNEFPHPSRQQKTTAWGQATRALLHGWVLRQQMCTEMSRLQGSRSRGGIPDQGIWWDLGLLGFGFFLDVQAVPSSLFPR